MTGFVDETDIVVSAGKGGNGSLSFRREKYVPRGGPDGGDGGRGGDVIFEVRDNLKTLSRLKAKRVFKAENGRPGEGRRKHGRNGNDVVIEVPPGTVIRDKSTGNILKDLSTEGRWVFLKGGNGGKGNWHFRSSVRQAPRFAQDGEAGAEQELTVEMNIIADIGFVGFPNAGKSSLLASLTNAHPKVADYPFTTKIPNLGVADLGYTDCILADIPGIIEGAAHGAGLGIRFLKHVARTSGLAFIIDIHEENPAGSFTTLLEELAEFGHGLIDKPRLVVASKSDLDPDGTAAAAFADAMKGEDIVMVSSFSLDGMQQLKKAFIRLLNSK